MRKVDKLVKEVKKDPQKGMSILVDAGIYDKEGELTENFS